MELDTPLSLLVHELKDLHSAELQLTKALPKMVNFIKSPKVAHVLEAHLEETQQHAESVLKLLSLVGEKPAREKCTGMAGIIAEAEKMCKIEGDDLLRDLGLISACERIEYYEVAGYTSAHTLSMMLGQDEVADVLKQILDQEHAAISKLRELATDMQSRQAGANEDDADSLANMNNSNHQIVTSAT